MRATLLTELEKRGHSLTKALVFQANRQIESDALDLLNDEVSSLCSEEDVRYVIIQDPDGQVLSEAARNGVDLVSIRAALAAQDWLPTEPGMMTIRSSGGSLYNFSAPVWRMHGGDDLHNTFVAEQQAGGKRLATVRVGLTSETTLGRIERAFWLSLAFVSVIFAAGLGGIIIVTRWALSPLSRMADAARSITAGDLSQRVEVSTRDEIGALGMAFNDMTGSLAQSRATLARRNEDLERVVGEHEKSLAELRETQDRLAHSESTRHAEKLRSVGQMASGVAHDFNNMLSVITGRVQLLRIKAGRNAVSSSDLQSALEIIERAALDGAETVRRIQEFSREKSGADMQRGDVNHMIREVVEITRPRWKDQVEQEGVRVGVKVSLSRVPQVACVASEIREVLTNLIFNAVDAMPAGGTITIRTSTENGGVLLSVSDTGTGMPPGVMERIFEPFYTTKGAKGNGLGLSIVYGIIQRHGGIISVAAGAEGGTEFQIRLPAADAAVPDVIAESMMTNRPGRFLVGDDEVNVRQALVDILIALGHEVTEAACGREILEKFEPGAFDMLFTDLGMPDLSGYEVSKVVRERDTQIPIVLVTGWGNQIRTEDAEARAVTRVLAKPFTIQKVSSVIAELQGLQKAA